MNLLTKKELYDNCDDDTILKDFFEEFSYLEELGEKNYKELNDYSIISGISIDKKDDEYEVSILISKI